MDGSTGPLTERVPLLLHFADLIDQLVDILHGLDLMQQSSILEVLVQQGQLGFGTSQFLLKPRQLLTIVVDHLPRQLANPVQFLKLVVQEQLPQYLVLPLGSVDLLSELVGILVELAILRPLEHRLTPVVIDRLQFLPLAALPLTLLLDAVLIRPLGLRLLHGGQFLGGSLLIPGLGQDVPKGEELLDLECGHCPAGDPVLDARDVDDDLTLHGHSLPGRPVPHVLQETPLEVFAVGRHHDPPDLWEIYQ